ncbi:MAG TPA: hypothetical protein VHE35_03775, partial [Kofleriaceae bacterium]|nr:hypothetical protein [Kofleriaceae bacterium]
EAAGLALAAGRAARHAAAFPLAFACHQRGLELAGPDAWTTAYERTRDLHAGAVEAAYLSAEWDAMAARAAALKAHARTALDQMIAWEVEIDACAGRHAYPAAIAAGRAALALLGVELPPVPGAAEIAAAVEGALGELMRLGPAALPGLPDADDPEVLAAMRLVVRLSPVAYFGQPSLLPILAAQIVTTSVRRGLTTATPYALALFGLVLNTIDLLPLAHELGQLAVRLLDRWPDRGLEAATRHLVFNLVTPWMQHLAAILDPLHDVWDLGRRTGDYEYAAYAGHGWVHDCVYVGRPLEPLYDEALAIGAEMRRLGQVNALHVHQPFEQLLRGLTGRLPAPPRLDDAGFDEEAHVAAAARDGSRSGVFIARLVMGLSRFLLGEPREAFAHLELARGHVDAAPSTPHLPVLHQYAALAACARYAGAGPDERARLDDVIDGSLEALGKVAAHAPVNVAHRIELVQAERARVHGDRDGARRHLEAAIAAARAGDWRLDLAVALELAARHHGGDLADARAAYLALGASGKL